MEPFELPVTMKRSLLLYKTQFIVSFNIFIDFFLRFACDLKSKTFTEPFELPTAKNRPVESYEQQVA